MTPTTATATSTDLTTLDGRCAGPVHTPGDTGYDEARQAWAAAVDQRPAAVVHPYDEDDVATVLRFAADAGLRVAPQGTGHNAAPLGDLSSTILLKTSAMQGVEIDPVARRARVRAGTLWLEVAEATAPHGLVALAGSSPDVGVVGYSLGGGIGWLARRHGMAANSITAVEVVTPAGELVRCDEEHEADLFWAIRGGGGSFGVVTALEFDLFEHATVSGGALAWDWSESERVLQRWAEWSATAPDEVSTSARILQLPPLEEIPEPLRGRQLVMIDGAHCGDPADAEACLAPLRELRPEIDMFGTIPSAALVRIHGDPEHPVPAKSDHAMVGELPAEAVGAFVGAAGPDSGSTLVMAELRQLGGALRRTPERHGVLPTLEAEHALFSLGMAITPEMGERSLADARKVTGALAPWCNGRKYLNFAETATNAADAYGADSLRRLQAIRAQADPCGLLHANHSLA